MFHSDVGLSEFIIQTSYMKYGYDFEDDSISTADRYLESYVPFYYWTQFDNLNFKHSTINLVESHIFIFYLDA
jgi:hypothetical protein